MFAVIFGRPGCPYCVRAKELAEKLTEERDDFNFRYVDIHAEGISKADLEKPWVNRLKPYRRFSSIRNTLAAAPISKPMPKKTWACSPLSNSKTPSTRGRFYLW
jgi:glutaredoxin